MQDSLDLKNHPLWGLVYDMVYNPDMSLGFNDNATEQWLVGEKDYFNGLSPVELFDSGEEGVREVIEFIEYEFRKKEVY